jgi:anti-sigma regulatory factor (Ser/Thr protein kinase)
MVLTSDGITEAHNTEGEMYGFPRLMQRVAETSVDMVSALVGDLERFCGPEAEQEDDITLVVVRREFSARASAEAFEAGPETVLTTFRLSSEEGNERMAIDKVAQAVTPLGLDLATTERLKTAVAESVMNAIEHGNKYQAELPVDVVVAATDAAVIVRVTDHGQGPEESAVTTPDIEAKITGEQTPRGWGLFLIEQMVDELRTSNSATTHTLELLIKREGAG